MKSWFNKDPEAYLEPSQTSMMEIFVDVWQGSKYASEDLESNEIKKWGEWNTDIAYQP